MDTLMEHEVRAKLDGHRYLLSWRGENALPSPSFCRWRRNGKRAKRGYLALGLRLSTVCFSGMATRHRDRRRKWAATIPVLVVVERSSRDAAAGTASRVRRARVLHASGC